MRKLLVILSLVVSAVSVCAAEAADSLVDAGAVVEGLFYQKTATLKEVIPGGSTLIPLKTPEGKRVLGVYHPQGFKLTDEQVGRAIPAEKVKFAAELLRDYDGRRPQSVQTYQGLGVKVGEPMVPFSYKDTDGRTWSRDSLKGRVYVINVWQRECGPCRGEMPVLSKWKTEWPDVVFLSASRHNADEIRAVTEQHNFTWTHLQEASDLVALVNSDGFPLTIVVDDKGIVRFAKVGASEENQESARAVIKDLVK